MSILPPPSLTQLEAVVQLAHAYLEQSDDMEAEAYDLCRTAVDHTRQWAESKPAILMPPTATPTGPDDQPTVQDLRTLVSLLNIWMPSEQVPAQASITLQKVQNWVTWLEQATPQDEIGMAADLLTYHGYKNPLGLHGEQVEPMLVISTSHIDEATAEALEKGATFGLVVYRKAGDGWWIYVGELSGEPTTEPDCLTECIQAAIDAGCVWLCIDMDAALHETLPTYAW